MPYLSGITGTDAAPDHRDHGQIHGLTHDTAHTVQTVRHAVGSDLHGSEASDNAHHDNASQLENTVFNTTGNANIKDLMDHRPVDPESFF